MNQDTTSKPLNADQQVAADEFFNFLLDPNVKEMNLRGPGGVGKSFTVAHLIDVVMPKYFATCKVLAMRPLYDEVVITATTNKAAEILAEATGRPTETIHSYLNLVIRNNYSTGEADLTRSKKWEVKERKIVFIDEASMIDTKLRRFINEGLHNSKIIYVGDHCQLPPIKETISPVYRDALLSQDLTIPMRTDRPELLAICKQFREIVLGNRGWGAIKLHPGIIDYADKATMFVEVQKHFVIEDTKSRILTYTNDKAVLYNEYTRSLRGHNGEFEEGEILISNSAVNLSSTERLSIEQQVTIVDRAPNTEIIFIDQDAELEVRRCDLDLGYGGIAESVPIPVDMEHLRALIKYYAKIKDWATYFSLKENYPDLRAKDACTVHKSQGSTYDTVFIDLSDLSNCRNIDVAARLFYVAVTRPRNRIVFFGQLAEKFGYLE